MKKIFKYILVAGLSFGLMSCDKFFDNMEGDLSKVAAEDLLSSENGLLALLANLYSNLPGMSMSTGDQSQLFANASRSTPSYASSVSGFWSYGSVRSVNKFLEEIENSYEAGIIDENTYNTFKGEALFVRACYYFASVRVYGGIPIVDRVLDDEYDGDKNEGLYIPRSTEKDSWDWVLDQFQQAADLLPTSQTQSMRANKYTALGMKARAALWAASVSKYWNRAPLNSNYTAVRQKLSYMESSYAAAYYDMAIAASDIIIKSGAYHLFGENPNSIDSAIGNLEELFQGYKPEEGLFGRSYVSGSSTSGNGNQGWGPNQVVSGYLQGTYSVTLNLADEYDYYASKEDRSRAGRQIQTLVSGDETAYFTEPETQFTAAKVADYKKYASVQEPFLLKDARFQAWVIYPGATFRGTTIYLEGGMVKPDGTPDVYPAQNTGVAKNGQTYYPYGGEGENNSAFYRLKTDVNSNNRTFYSFVIRKSLDPDSNNPNPQTPWYDMRYSEILLTYAEAVVESGKGDKTLAAKCLNDVRHRAGFTDDVALTIENVLHEWKVEFAFENKWTNVLFRRRAFYNPDTAATEEEGSVGRKLTLIPMVDLSGDEAQWIFLRSLPYNATAKAGYNGTLRVKADDYYSQIPNYTTNRLVPNNLNVE